MSRTRIWLGLSIFLVIVANWRWFFTPHIYSWGDWGYHNPEFIRSLFNFPQAWHREFMGVVDIGLPQYLTARLLYSILAHFLSPAGYDRLIFLLPAVLFPAVSVFLLVRSVTKNSLAGFVGSVVYSFNTYILLLNSGHFTLSTAFAIGPLVFLLYRAALTTGSLKYALGAGLAGFISAGYDPRGFFLIAILLVLYFIYRLAFITGFKPFFLFLGVLPFIIVGFTQAYWILSFTQTARSYQGIAINRPLGGETESIFPRGMLLSSPWWTGNSEMAWGIIQSIPVYFWPIPVIAAVSFWVSRRRPEIMFWAMITLVGIFLVKMTGDPFGRLYRLMYDYLPGFNAFRESSKFNYYVSLGYAILIGNFVALLHSGTLIRTRFKTVLTLIILAIFLYNAKPLVLGQLGHLQTPRKIPRDYLVLNDFLRSQPPFFRVLYLPEFSRWAYRDIDRRLLSVSRLVGDQWRPLNDYRKEGLEYSAFEEFTNIFTKPFADQLLDASSVKYIIVPSLDLENEEAFIYPRGTSPEQFSQFLRQFDFLKPIDINTPNLTIYENKDYLPHFSFDPPVDYQVSCPAATSCTFKFGSSSPAIRFHFSEQYHPGWKVRLGEFSWWKSLITPGYFLPEDNHLATEFATNEFTLPALLEGGSFTLYFSPQALVNLGATISGFTFISILSALWYLRKR